MLYLLAILRFLVLVPLLHLLRDLVHMLQHVDSSGLSIWFSREDTPKFRHCGNSALSPDERCRILVETVLASSSGTLPAPPPCFVVFLFFAHIRIGLLLLHCIGF